jgi:uncharacterized membrane protein
MDLLVVISEGRPITTWYIWLTVLSYLLCALLNPGKGFVNIHKYQSIWSFQSYCDVSSVVISTCHLNNFTAMSYDVLINVELFARIVIQGIMVD